VVGAVYGNLPEKLSGASMYFLSFFFFQTLLAILFSLELLNYLVSYTSLCSVLVFLKGRGVRYDTSWLAVEIAFFHFFSFFSLSR